MKRIPCVTRRHFLKEAFVAGTVFTIVPRHVLAGGGQPPPSVVFDK